MPTKAQALRTLATRQRQLNDAETKATQAAEARAVAVLSAQGAGATYGELEEATGLSTSRVTQVLRRARQVLQVTQ